jgi:hypothetical protein
VIVLPAGTAAVEPLKPMVGAARVHTGADTA